MATAQKIIERAATLGVHAKLWEKAGRTRIYAHTGRKDLSVYLECDGDSAEIEGAAFKVYCSTPQHPAWIKSQIDRAKKNFIALFWAYVVETYPESDLNGLGVDIRDMIAEARAFVAARAAEATEEVED